MARWMPFAVLVWAAGLMVACGSPEYVAQPTPATSTPEAVSIRDAFAQAQVLGKGEGSRISVVPGRVPLVRLGGVDRLAVAGKVDGSKPHVIKVRSFVVRRPDGSFVLFYPVVSLVNDDLQGYRTVKPKYEFVFRDNVLTNEFEVPAGVERILIHTDEEFTRGSFTADTSPGQPLLNPGQSAAVGGALGATGGALGGAIAGGVSSLARKGEGHEFRFGDVGVITVESD